MKNGMVLNKTKKNLAVVEVKSGVAEVVYTSGNVEVMIVDLDLLEEEIDENLESCSAELINSPILEGFIHWIKDHPEVSEISISKNKYNTTICLWNSTDKNRQIELNFNTSTGELTDWFVNDEVK